MRGENRLENRFYCEEGCGKWTPLKETDSDGSENTVASWNCGCWINKPSDKNCHKCNRNLTQGEKKTCYGRSSDENNIEFVCDSCCLGNEIPNFKCTKCQKNFKYGEGKYIKVRDDARAGDYHKSCWEELNREQPNNSSNEREREREREQFA